MLTTLTIDVVGTPAPQGSKRGIVVNGRAVLVDDNKKTRPWRQDVTAAVVAAMTETGWETAAGAVRVDITYWIARPRYHFGTGRNAHLLKPNAPVWVDKKPDRDKLDRATFDALTASGVIRDDAQIVAGESGKRYAGPGNGGATGARIEIALLSQSTASALGGEAGAGAVQPQLDLGQVS